MNAERLHAIAAAIRTDFGNTNFLPKLQQLVQSTANLSQQPNQQQFQNQVAQYREAVIDALRSSKLNEFSPAWRQVIAEIGGEIFFDGRLEGEITNLFSINQVTPNALNSSLQKIHADAQGWFEAITELNNAFDRLDIGSEDLSPGECELGVLIPRTFVDNRLDRFSAELSQLNKMFSVFAEITTGSRPGFKIRTISSSDLTIYLEAAPKVCACIALAIERIVALYKSLLEIRKLQGELKKQGLQDDSLKGVREHAENLITQGVDKIADEILEKNNVKQRDGRENEISIELRMTLKKIAARIDRGFNIEIRMEMPRKEQVGEAVENEAISSFETIKEAGPNMQFLKMSGDPILTLPNGDADGEPDKSKSPAN